MVEGWTALLREMTAAVRSKRIDERNIQELPSRDFLASARARTQLRRLYRNVLRFGRRQMLDEIDRQIKALRLEEKQEAALDMEEGGKAWTQSLINGETRINIAVGQMQNQIAGSFAGEYGRLASQGLGPGKIADGLEKFLSQLSTKGIENLGRGLVNQGHNAGRNIGVQSRLKNVGRVIRSEVLDPATCKICDTLDGRVFKVNSALYREFMPPNKCLGKASCRGFYLAVVDDATKTAIPKEDEIPAADRTIPASDYNVNATSRTSINREARAAGARIVWSNRYLKEAPKEFMLNKATAITREVKRLKAAFPGLRIKTLDASFTAGEYGSNGGVYQHGVIDSSDELGFSLARRKVRMQLGGSSGKAFVDSSKETYGQSVVRHEFGHHVASKLGYDNIHGTSIRNTVAWQKIHRKYPAAWWKRNVSNYANRTYAWEEAAAQNFDRKYVSKYKVPKWESEGPIGGNTLNGAHYGGGMGVERFSETFAMVTSSYYKAGTLPRDIEEFFGKILGVEFK